MYVPVIERKEREVFLRPQDPGWSFCFMHSKIPISYFFQVWIPWRVHNFEKQNTRTRRCRLLSLFHLSIFNCIIKGYPSLSMCPRYTITVENFVTLPQNEMINHPLGDLVIYMLGHLERSASYNASHTLSTNPNEIPNARHLNSLINMHPWDIHAVFIRN